MTDSNTIPDRSNPTEVYDYLRNYLISQNATENHLLCLEQLYKNTFDVDETNGAHTPKEKIKSADEMKFLVTFCDSGDEDSIALVNIDKSNAEVIKTGRYDRRCGYRGVIGSGDEKGRILVVGEAEVLLLDSNFNIEKRSNPETGDGHGICRVRDMYCAVFASNSDVVFFDKNLAILYKMRVEGGNHANSVFFDGTNLYVTIHNMNKL